MIYQINGSYFMNGKTITILSAFESDALTEDGDCTTTFYYVHMQPDNLNFVIREEQLQLQDFKNYIPTIANGIASRGSTKYLCASKSEIKEQFNLWKDMIYRCYLPTSTLYPLYGAKGITVCAKWLCFEYYMYDYIMCGMSMYDDDGKSSVITFFPGYLGSVPEPQRCYSASTAAVDNFYGSDVMDAVNFINTRKKQEANHGRFLNPNRQSVPAQQPVQNKSGSGYTREDYERVINDPSFMDQYPKLGNNVNMIYPCYGNLEPASPTHREPDKNVMCVIVPPGTTRLKYQKPEE